MTIKEYCEKLPTMRINKLIEKIANDGFKDHERTIISCMDAMDKIEINHAAKFDSKTVNV